LDLQRYRELYAGFLGEEDQNAPAVSLFGPIKVV